jgi:copper chaperone NosL
MTIVDQQHAAELVTKKGKAYKYDAIECMLQDKANNQPTNVALYLTMDYDSPKTFIDATQATFLISKKVPSPMGAYLSAFEKYENAKQLQEEKSGQLYNWEEIKQKFEEE